MENPFSSEYRDKTDDELIQSALNGSMAALEALLLRHQHYIFNIAIKMTGNLSDAEDVTQEVLIKVITKLAQFKQESNFRTWIYRITFNHFLQMKKSLQEQSIVSFEIVEKQLDAIPDESLSELEMATLRGEIEETKLNCMNGMLLCLEREQRLIFIIGEIFNANHTLGASMLEITKDNFRQKLSRARRDLHNFMNRKCGLINPDNPCRCAGKTKGFIKAGKVNPENLQFYSNYLKSIQEYAGSKKEQLEDFITENFTDIYSRHPFQEKNHQEKIFKRLLKNNSLTDIFDLEMPDNFDEVK
jgi:RNA polymerase sigma factor (sigma-70 family)